MPPGEPFTQVPDSAECLPDAHHRIFRRLIRLDRLGVDTIPRMVRALAEETGRDPSHIGRQIGEIAALYPAGFAIERDPDGVRRPRFLFRLMGPGAGRPAARPPLRPAQADLRPAQADLRPAQAGSAPGAVPPPICSKQSKNRGEDVQVRGRDDVSNPNPGPPDAPAIPAPRAETDDDRDARLTAHWGSLTEAERGPILADVRRSSPTIRQFEPLILAKCLAMLAAADPARYPPIVAGSPPAAPPSRIPRTIAERIAALGPATAAAEREEIAKQIAVKFNDWDYLGLTLKMVNAAGLDIPAAELERIFTKATRRPQDDQARAFGRAGKQWLLAHGIAVGTENPPAADPQKLAAGGRSRHHRLNTIVR